MNGTLIGRTRPFLEAGEEPEHAIPVQQSLNPWWIVVGILFWPLLIVILIMWKNRVVVVTDRATVLLSAPTMSPKRPKALLDRMPKGVLEAKLTGVWGTVQLAGQRYYIHRRYFREARAVLGEPDPASVGAGAASGAPAGGRSVAPSSVRVSVAGRDEEFGPTDVVTFGRDERATVTTSNPAASRGHAVLEFADGVWTFRDTSSRNGTYHDGARVATVEIDGVTEVRLGHATNGELVTITPVAPAPVVLPAPAPAPATSADTDAPGDAPSDAPADAPAASETAPVGALRIRCSGHEYTFEPGAVIVLGRDDDCDVQADNPLASRHHARITTDGGGWYVEDTGSSRGTFWDDQPVTRQRITGAMTVWLGPVDAGEEVLLVTAGETPPSRAAEAAAKGKRNTVIAAIAGAVVVALVAVVAVVAISSGSDTAAVDLTHLRKSTVYIDAFTKGDDGKVHPAWSGSGTIVASNGLILTNAHVAEPNAPGAGVESGGPITESDPALLVIKMNRGGDDPAKLKYSAKTVAADGYLDLAVLRIDGEYDAKGKWHRIDPDDLDLEHIELGDSDEVHSGDEITVLGYPGVAETESVTVTRGVIGSPVRDPLGRVKGQPVLLNTDAAFFHGNSGGLAADRSGRIIGVPSQGNPEIEDEGDAADISGSQKQIRPVNLARPLIEAAESGRRYRTDRFSVPLTNGASLKAVGVSGGSESPCTARFTSYKGSVSTVRADFQGTSVPSGLDLLVKVYQIQNGKIVDIVGARRDLWVPKSGQCQRLEVRVSDSQGNPLTSGTYGIVVRGGPNYEKELGALPFTVTP